MCAQDLYGYHAKRKQSFLVRIYLQSAQWQLFSLHRCDEVPVPQHIVYTSYYICIITLHYMLWYAHNLIGLCRSSEYIIRSVYTNVYIPHRLAIYIYQLCIRSVYLIYSRLLSVFPAAYVGTYLLYFPFYRQATVLSVESRTYTHHIIVLHTHVDYNDDEDSRRCEDFAPLDVAVTELAVYIYGRFRRNKT